MVALVKFYVDCNKKKKWHGKYFFLYRIPCSWFHTYMMDTVMNVMHLSASAVELFEYGTISSDCYMVHYLNIQFCLIVTWYSLMWWLHIYIYTYIYICWILNTMLYITFVFYIFKVLHNWTIFFLNENFHVGIFSDICICYFFETQNDGLLLLSVLLHVHVSLDDL